MSDEIQVAEINAEASVWAAQTGAMIKSAIRSLSSKGKGELMANLRSSVKRKDGLPNKITFSFPLHGVFFQKGVGRGYISVNGVVMHGQKEGKVLKKKNDGNNTTVVSGGALLRKPQDFFNGIIESRIPLLADTMANYMADMQVNQINPYIK